MGRKRKNFIYYDLNTSVVEEIMAWLAQLRKEDDENEEK